MRNFIFVLLSALSLSFVSCNPQPTAYVQPVPTTYDADYQVIQNGNQQMVVVRDNDGSQFLMNYILFQSLMGRGYGNVINYYHSHPTISRPYNSTYSSWRSVRRSSFGRQSYSPTYINRVRTTTRNSYTTPSSGFRSSSPKVVTNPNSGFRSRTTTTRSWFSSPSTPRVRTSSSFSSSSRPSSSFRSSSSSFRSSTPRSSSSSFRSSGFRRR